MKSENFPTKDDDADDKDVDEKDVEGEEEKGIMDDLVSSAKPASSPASSSSTFFFSPAKLANSSHTMLKQRGTATLKTDVTSNRQHPPIIRHFSGYAKAIQRFIILPFAGSMPDADVLAPLGLDTDRESDGDGLVAPKPPNRLVPFLTR